MADIRKHSKTPSMDENEVDECRTATREKILTKTDFNVFLITFPQLLPQERGQRLRFGVT